MLFSFVRRIILRMRDIRTVKELCLGAERYAHENGEDVPGAEHFLLAAIDLPDGSARRVFERIGANPDELGNAIKKQYNEALKSIGIDPSRVDVGSEAALPRRVLYDSKPSAQSLMKDLVEHKRKDKDVPLLGAHVVDVAVSKEQGVVARTLKAMGVSQAALKNAVKEELKNYSV